MSDYPRPVRVQYKEELEEVGIALADDLVEVAMMGLMILEVHDLIRIDGELREVTGLRKTFVTERPGMEGADGSCRITHRSLRDASLQDLEVLLEPWEAGPNKPQIQFSRLPDARVEEVPGQGYLRITDPGPGARSVRGPFEPADTAGRKRLGRLLDSRQRVEFVGKIQKAEGPIRTGRMQVLVSKVPGSGPCTLQGVGDLLPLH